MRKPHELFVVIADHRQAYRATSYARIVATRSVRQKQLDVRPNPFCERDACSLSDSEIAIPKSKTAQQVLHLGSAKQRGGISGMQSYRGSALGRVCSQTRSGR